MGRFGGARRFGGGRRIGHRTNRIGWGHRNRHRYGVGRRTYYSGGNTQCNPFAGCVTSIILGFMILGIVSSALGGLVGSSTMADCTTPSCTGTNLRRCWNSLDWSDLASCEKTNWGLVGYNQAVWDSGQNPSDATKTWNDLATSQRTGLIALGYTEGTWTQSNESDDRSSMLVAAFVILVLPMFCCVLFIYACNKSKSTSGAVLGTVNNSNPGAAAGTHPVATPAMTTVPVAAYPVTAQPVPFHQAVAVPIQPGAVPMAPVVPMGSMPMAMPAKM
jgi:hypothetical protein